MNQPANLDVFTCALNGINLIEASAGTGKTWNICGLYLRLLLERRMEVQQILVVTFTNAATAELRERIRSRIVETIEFIDKTQACAGDPFVPSLVTELTVRHGMATEEMALRLNLALQTFDEASIYTIHGFCQRALADTPFSAGLPMSMELLQDDGDLLLEAVHDYWRRHIAGDALMPELAAFLMSSGDTPDKYARLLKRHLAKPLARSLWPDDIDTASTIDSSALLATYSAARTTWQAHRADVVDLLIKSIPSLNGTTYKEEAVGVGANQWDEAFRIPEPLAPLGDKVRLYRDAVLEDRTKKKCSPPHHPFFTEAEAYLALRETADSTLTASRLRLIRALFDDAGARLREAKRSRRIVSFDDMLFNVYERLSNGQYPWLAKSLKERFPAALIDEFQDTDPMQFEIFHKIYGGGDTPLFLVGDPKQAIYSFRQADLHTYLRAKEQASAEYSLVANQRSTEGLLTALNGLFGTNDKAFILPRLDYLQVEFGDKKREPFVDQSAARADLQVWMLPSDAEPLEKKPARRAVVRATAAEIARLLTEASAGRITVDGKPLSAGDIAVLVRSHVQGTEMKRALEKLKVGSVEIAQASVFQSADAEAIETTLKGILEPTRDPLVRAALASELFGLDAAEIEVTSNDEALMMRRIEQFTDYRNQWIRRGFGIMYRNLLATEHVAQRMLTRPDGERRLTNYLHLGECLHRAAETHPSPEALLRFLQTQRQDGSADDAAQLRLESDQNLVKIITIHKAKGLEYPIVFCPFLWDGRTSFGGQKIEGKEYHDDDKTPVIDFRGDTLEKAQIEQIKDKIKTENAAETLRLIYVSLTRAVYRCYLVAGCYLSNNFGNLSSSESTRSMLNWLAAGQGRTPEDWFGAKMSPDNVATAWKALAERAGPCINVSPLPTDAGRPIESAPSDPATLKYLPAPGNIPSGWRLSSYSGLSHGAISEQAASDHDARIVSLPRSVAMPEAIATDDILRFPRGAAAGECIHAVFERVDFTDSKSWDPAIASALADHAQTLPGLPAGVQVERLSSMLHRLLEDVTSAELVDGLRLNTVTATHRLTELEFHVPVPHLPANELNQGLKSLGYAVPRLTFNNLEGYLKGFIDLTFEHQGRFYILDWKSNHLGYESKDYAATPIEGAMIEHGYHLQYLLYTVALDRYLKRRVADYSYETHFGGVLYLFVRGVRPTWKNDDGKAAGVLFHRPALDTVRQLNGLLGTAPKGAAA